MTGWVRRPVRPGRLVAGALWLLLAAAAAVFALAAGTLVLGLHDNRQIDALAAGRPVAAAEAAAPELRFARAHYLMLRDRLDEAQAEVDALDREGAGPRAAAHYDLANARLRAALEHLEASRLDPAIPLVRLAKDGYRRALALDPGLWDAKHNLDVAMRLVRDFPEIEGAAEEQRAETPKRLWTDLPGLPKGLP